MLQRILRDRPRVPKPSPIRLHPPGLGIGRLVLSSLDDLASRVADGGGGLAGEEVNALGFLRRTVEVLSCSFDLECELPSYFGNEEEADLWSSSFPF